MTQRLRVVYENVSWKSDWLELWSTSYIEILYVSRLNYNNWLRRNRQFQLFSVQ